MQKFKEIFNIDAQKFSQMFLNEQWVIGYDNLGQKLPRERITTTGIHVRYIVFGLKLCFVLKTWEFQAILIHLVLNQTNFFDIM